MASENIPTQDPTPSSIDTLSKFECNISSDEALDIFKELCQKLDISDQLMYLSIKDYTAVKSCFILQGDQKLWLICALYGLVLSISNGGGTGLYTQSSMNYVMMEIPIHNRKANTPNYTNTACRLLKSTTSNNGVGINNNNNNNHHHSMNINTNITTTNNNVTVNNNNNNHQHNGSMIPSQTLISSDNSESNALLSKILGLIKINVNFFFSKFNNWMRMIDLPKHVTQLLSSIEMSENVTYVMFKKYLKIFPIFFNPPYEYMLVDLKGNKRKTRKRTCDSNELFHFCWFLFVATKELTSIIYDISAGFHLLLQSIKFAYINIIRDNDLASRLLAQHFIDNEDNFNLLKKASVLELDNSFYDVLVAHNIQFVREEANLIFQRTFIPAMEFIKQQNQFLFNFSTYKSALEPEHITNNLKYLIELYRDYRILHFGIDEMDYVKLLYKNEIYVPLLPLNDVDNNKDVALSTLNKNDKYTINSLDPFKENNMKTPLSKKSDSSVTSYDDLSLSLSPVDYVMNLLHSLRKIIYDNDGSSYKSSLFKLLEINSLAIALKKAQSLPETALDIFNNAINTQDNNVTYYMDSWQICNDLYYKILYVATENELSKTTTHNGNFKDFMAFLSSHIFHKSLLAICYDIFIFINNCQKPFPWISTVFDIEPFYLIQCIELVVRNESKLPRVIIKHLTIIEEDIISYYGWISTSPIYSRLDSYVNNNNNNENNDENEDKNENENENNNENENEDNDDNDDKTNTKISNENISNILPYFCNVKLDGVFDYNEALVGITESLYDRFECMNAGYLETNPMFNNFCNVDICYKLKPSSKKMIPSSISIFYQKVYYIILTRLNDFGIKLKLSRGEKAIIWKCMEYLVVSHTYLMKNHHIDQLIICSIYTILKVINRQINFSTILHHYVTQPQAKIAVYRFVPTSIIDTLLHNNTLSINFTFSSDKNEIKAFLNSIYQRIPAVNGNNDEDNTSSSTKSVSTTMGDTTATTYIIDDDTKDHILGFFTEKQLTAMKDESCDIIQFYNKIFAHVIQHFANEIAQSFIHRTIVVEPYPILKTDSLISPLRVSQNYSVYVSPMKLSNVPNQQYNVDQPNTPFINKINNTSNNFMRFHLTNEKSPMVCREINRFIAETKQRDHEYNTTHLNNPVKRRLIIEEDESKKIVKTDQQPLTIPTNTSESRSLL